MPMVGSNPASLVISSDRGSLYMHKDPWVTTNKSLNIFYLHELMEMSCISINQFNLITLNLPTILSSSCACSSSSPAFPLYRLKVCNQSSKLPYSVSSSLLKTCKSVDTQRICMCTRAVVGLLSKVRARPAYQQLVHFSFARSLLGAVCSVTLLLILESLLVFALFSRPGAF